MRHSESIRFFDFSGGLQTRPAITALDLKAASDEQNINLLPSGGFSARLGNGAHNASVMGSSTTVVTSCPYFRLASGSDFLCATAAAVFYADANVSGTMVNRTGTVTITSGANNFWTASVMNDLLIMVGGAPDAPFTYSGTGNAAALGGTPPSGNFGIQANNYFFIGNTTANPSRIQWSILGDPATWTGTGSGNSDIWKDDGDTLVGAALLGVDRLFLFKQNSIHMLVARTPAFPVFPKFKGVGAVSKRGIVEYNGMIYFITPQPRMKATDGDKIYEFPDTIDDVWDGLSVSRLKYTHGHVNKRLNQIWWYVSNGTSTTNNLCIVWDIQRKCWLRHTTGYGMNCSSVVQDYLYYAGAYDGKIYQQDKATTYADASETSPGAINAYWRTGWLDLEDMIQTKTIPYFQVGFLGQTTGTFDAAYGYNFSQDTGLQPVSMVLPGSSWDAALWDVGKWGGQSNSIKHVFTKGNGKVVQFLIRHNSSVEGFTFNGLEVPIKEHAPALIR